MQYSCVKPWVFVRINFVAIAHFSVLTDANFELWGLFLGEYSLNKTFKLMIILTILKDIILIQNEKKNQFVMVPGVEFKLWYEPSVYLPSMWITCGGQGGTT